MRKRKQLERQLQEMQAEIDELRAAPPSVYPTYTVSTSTYGGGGGGAADITWDPGRAQLQELINHPSSERARELKDMTPAEVPEGKTVYELVEEAIRAHDEELLRLIRQKPS